MASFDSVDWEKLFVPDTPLLEIFLRGSVVYLGLFVMLRLILKRQAGNVTMSDMLVMVLLADASQNAMADDYKSLPDGLFLAGTLIFWNFALEWLGFRFPRFGVFLHPKPLPLIVEGRLIRPNLEKELITEDELKSHMREQGIEHFSDVKRASLEGDGRISFIQKEPQQHPGQANQGQEMI
jgi:uncharacterized membrane protein YcaP (DUF421 family)